MQINDLGERGWIDRIAAKLNREGEGVICGIGDDAAVLEPRDDRLLIATGDVQVQGVHFLLEHLEPRVVGSRAAAVNLSDVAAMGASPKWALVSLCAPPQTEVDALEAIYEGFVSELEGAGARLVGGNTSRIQGNLVIDVFLIGEVERECVLLRSGARPGDVICVTGELGAARAGLLVLEGVGAQCDATAREIVVGRHAKPLARLTEGRLLGRSGAVTACIDLSDGLVADAEQIAKCSGVTIVLDAARVPISPVAAQVAIAAGREPLDLALNGGEDFELLFAIEPTRAPEVIGVIERECGTPCRVIGRVSTGAAQVRVERDGVVFEVAEPGFDHFGS